MNKQPKQSKDRWLGARVTGETYEEVERYTAAAEIVPAELLRRAVKEYMINHPIKKAVETPSLKPGE